MQRELALQLFGEGDREAAEVARCSVVAPAPVSKAAQAATIELLGIRLSFTSSGPSGF